MNLNSLFEIQKRKYDALVRENNINTSQIKKEIFLALLSKLGDLSRETESYMFWKKDKTVDKEKVLNSYIDCMSLILIIGLNYNYTNVGIDRDEIRDFDLNQTLLNIYIDVNELVIVASEDSYEELFKDFVTLSKLLDLDRSEVYEAFVKKNSQ